MNTTILKNARRSVLSAAAILSITNVFGGSYEIDTRGLEIESNLTVNLTALSIAPGLLPRDGEGKIVRGDGLVFENDWGTKTLAGSVSNSEIGSQIVSARFSNREILTEAILGDQRDTTIKGWALKLITPAERPGFSTVFSANISAPSISPTRMIAVKKGKEPVLVSNLSVFRGMQVQQGKANFSRTFNINTRTETTRQSGFFSMLRQVEVELDLFGANIEFIALEDTQQFIDPTVKGDFTGFFLPLTSKFTIAAADVSFGDIGWQGSPARLDQEDDFKDFFFGFLLLGDMSTNSPKFIGVLDD